MAYAGANTVTLNSASSVQNTLLAGIIFTGVAALVALIATVLNLPALLKEPSAGRIVSTGVSVIVLVASVLFLVLNLVPRVSPLNHLSNDLQPFGNALTKDCSDPLNQLTRDEHTVYLDSQVSQTGDASGDAGFVKLLSVDIPQDSGGHHGDLRTGSINSTSSRCRTRSIRTWSIAASRTRSPTSTS